MNILRFTSDCDILASDTKQPAVSIVAYSGGTMKLPGLGPTVVDLAGMELATIPLLADHKNTLDSIAGTGTPTVDNGTLTVNGKLAGGTVAADQVIALHRSGIRLQASIGAEIESQKYIQAGESVTANGRTHVAPAGGLSFVTTSKLREVSFVAAGADSSTSVSIAAKRKAMQTDFDSWCDSLGIDRSLMSGTQLANLHANYAGRMTVNDSDHVAVAPFITASADPVQAEQLRLKQIEAACRGDWEAEADAVHQLKIKAVANEISIDELLTDLRQIRCTLIEGKIPMAQTVYTSTRQSETKAIEAAFAISCGIAHPEKHFGEQVLDAADQFKGFGLQQLLLHAAAQNGFEDFSKGTSPGRPERAFARGVRDSFKRAS